MMVFVETVMMGVILLLFGALAACVMWLARKDGYFRWWLNGAILKYYNSLERTQPEENRPLLDGKRKKNRRLLELLLVLLPDDLDRLL